MRPLSYYLTERNGGIDKGCAMLYFNVPAMKKIHEMIDPEDIYDEEGFGLETESHCTLLYGFHCDVTEGDEVIQLIKTMDIPDDIKLMNASLFENDYDVLKFDVKADGLHKINKMLTDKFEYSTDYPDYHPHCTIAYLKKGTGKKYVKMLEGKEFEVEPKSVVYSDSKRNKIIEEL